MFRSLIILASFVASVSGSIVLAQGLEFNQTLNCQWVEPIQTGYLQNHLVFTIYFIE